MRSPTLTFLGAAGTVTGSRFLLELDEARALVDAGLYQGLKQLRLRNWEPLPVDPWTLDSVALGTLPPTLVLAAEHDILCDEDEDLARRIEKVGVPVQRTTYPGMIHGFWRHPELFDSAEESLAEIAEFLRRVVPAEEVSREG